MERVMERRREMLEAEKGAHDDLWGGQEDEEGGQGSSDGSESEDEDEDEDEDDYMTRKRSKKKEKEKRRKERRKAEAYNHPLAVLRRNRSTASRPPKDAGYGVSHEGCSSTKLSVEERRGIARADEDAAAAAAIAQGQDKDGMMAQNLLIKTIASTGYSFFSSLTPTPQNRMRMFVLAPNALFRV
jgi:hypothetical protein